jgi:probable rRNA maturation factor
MKLSLDISVPSPLWRRLPRARPIAREAIAAAASESQGTVRIDRPEGRASLQTPYDGDVSLCLADDSALRALNLSWRGIDKPTNVLSFPAAPGRPGEARTLGDIALAYETLAREAEDLGVSLADHYRHLLVHGFLHLIGYDHETDADAERMEALEARILARLGVADPYAREVVGG